MPDRKGGPPASEQLIYESDWLERRSTVEEVLGVAAARIATATGEAPGEVVVPTSGGLDSRLINLLIEGRRLPPPPLDVGLLRDIMWPDYVRRVNRHVFRREVKALKGMSVREPRLPAYGANLTLLPNERLSRRRDQARRGDVLP